MATLVLRNVKGSPLTISEVDGNFSNLNSDIGVLTNLTTTANSNLVVAINSVSSQVVNINTSNVAEGGNLFFTNARVYSNVVLAGFYDTVSNTAPIGASESGTTLFINHLNSGVSASTYGGGTFVPVIAVDATGHVTSASNATITVANTSITGKILNSQIESIANSSITGNIIASQIEPTGVVANTYGNATVIPSFVVDTQGRITSASNATTIVAGSGITITDSGGSLTFASSVSGVPYIKHELFTSSGTFTAKVTGQHMITVVGGGGSGGTARGSHVNATGGGAGAVVFKVVSLTAGNTYTVTIGAGGTAITQSSAGATAGNLGGNSSISGTGITTITALGGGGGNATSGGSAAAASGGVASGGDVNINGGGSGAATGGASSRNATGGGSVGILGTAYSSGSASCTSGGGSGGAGVGGGSGSVGGAGATQASGGGGSGAASATNSITGGAAATTLTIYAPSLPIVLNGVGGAGSSAGAGLAPTAGTASGISESTGGAGGGGGGAGGGDGTAFGGGGASYGSSGDDGGDGVFGGGGGAAVASSGTFTSGAGGSGIVLIQW